MIEKPVLCQVTMEFVILQKEVGFGFKGRIVGNVNHRICVGNDNSIYLQEVLVTPSKDEVLHSSVSHGFKEFAEKFPEDAVIIMDFLVKHNAKVPWLYGRCEV